MSKTNSLEGSLLAHIFQNANIANVGDATGLRGSTAVGNLYWSLHTADPGEAGSQATSECAYTGYVRQAAVRSVAGFSITGNSVSPAAEVSFPAATAGTETATHFGIGTDASGAGTLLYKGAIAPTIAISNGVTPKLTTQTAITEE